MSKGLQEFGNSFINYGYKEESDLKHAFSTKYRVAQKNVYTLYSSISFKFIPKILMSKGCIHFFGPLCTVHG